MPIITMKDILLIQPPIEDFYLTVKRTIPYGLCCIASNLIKNGFSVEIFDCLASKKSKIIDWPEEFVFLKEFYSYYDSSPFSLFHNYRHFGYSWEYIIKRSKEINPYIIGISSLFTAYSNEALFTAQKIKIFLPNIKIVMGGHHPTAIPEHVMECKAVDYVLRGDGEVSMPLLAKALKFNQDIKTIPGIVYRKKDGSIIINKPAYMENLNHYPLPAANLIKHSYYKRNKKNCFVVTASRGCPLNCSYCALGSSIPSFRLRNVESVFSEIKQLICNYNAAFIDFEDENLTINKKWFMSLMNLIIKNFNNHKLELRAMNGLFPLSIDEEIIIAMKNAGFKILNLSLGSTCPKQLKRFKRPDITKSIDKILDLCQKYNMESVCYIIAGALHQKPVDSINDLLYLAQRKTLVGVSVFYPAPLSLDYQIAKKNNLLPEKYSLMRASTIPFNHLTSRLDSITILRLNRILNFMKYLVKIKEKIPEPEPFSYNFIFNELNRIETGKILLKWFLFDGKIRGISESGKIFEHNINNNLSDIFINRISNIKILM